MKHGIITICFMIAAMAGLTRGAELLVPSQFPTIQMAVNAAANGDTVIIADGTYSGPGNSQITVSKPITIRSENGPETCILDFNAGPGSRVGFIMQDGTLVGLTIKGGFSMSYGGAVTCYNGRAKITNCILTNNQGTRGGAVYCRNGNLEILNCSLTNNSSIPIPGGPATSPGGAIYCENGSVFIANSTISGNSGSQGAGIYCYQNSNVTIKNCIISENSSFPQGSVNSFGGGIYCERGALTVIGSQITGNSAASGAGIYCLETANFFISDCNIEGNIAGIEKITLSGLSGGGIYFKATSPPYPYAAAATIFNSSITDNIVRGQDCKGAGLYIETSITPIPSPQNVNIMISGCVIARNRFETPPGSSAPPGPSYGGGLYCNGQVRLFETDITDNSAFQGGGIYNEGPRPVIDISRCRISGNSAQNMGTAILSRAGEISIENSVISNNRGREGYAIRCEQFAILKMSNCTVVGNSPPVFIASGAPPGSHFLSLSSITNSIIYNNCRDSYASCKQQLPPHVCLVSHSDVEGGFDGVGNIDAEPCFAQPGHWDTNGTPNPYDDFWVEGDYRLTAVSPCIDTGGVAFLIDNKDLAGKPRIAGAAIDMGAFEYQNTLPVANAGEDFNAFAWIEGKAKVTLDASASYDADGDMLTYLWDWTSDSNSYEADGVKPVVELPVGEQAIELIVNDGLENSLPDIVNVTVVGAVEGRAWIMPSFINPHWRQGNILAMLKLPEGITKEQIDSNYRMQLYPGGIEAKKQNILMCWNEGHQKVAITAFFDKAAVLDAVSDNGIVRLDVVGRLVTGQYFFGESTVRIIDITVIPKPANSEN